MLLPGRNEGLDFFRTTCERVHWLWRQCSWQFEWYIQGEDRTAASVGHLRPSISFAKDYYIVQLGLWFQSFQQSLAKHKFSMHAALLANIWDDLKLEFSLRITWLGSMVLYETSCSDSDLIRWLLPIRRLIYPMCRDPLLAFATISLGITSAAAIYDVHRTLEFIGVYAIIATLGTVPIRYDSLEVISYHPT